jgi:hypothetical protein
VYLPISSEEETSVSIIAVGNLISIFQIAIGNVLELLLRARYIQSETKFAHKLSIV